MEKFQYFDGPDYVPVQSKANRLRYDAYYNRQYKNSQYHPNPWRLSRRRVARTYPILSDRAIRSEIENYANIMALPDGISESSL